MPTWSVQEDISSDDEVGQEEAASWDVDDDFVPSIENGAWGMSKASLSPNATDNNSALSFGGHAASEFGFLPGDVSVVPSITQGDKVGWTIEADPPIND